ncbi:uncharacterized protein PGTG_22158 [Puccinia graminis f. sp. tritici CRL 75-36-700-3]|uniref:Uncharacterized protein n=1 Tax=Puccinia graminis f. sp. tritici (strain CRL 75-36-700-3 / race SCCL) TaxID=418459 RepID=H6QTR6_PUCGT|nr:uncharacterized protein PGTG_22158 [Puccinia graminis f. sp. tritici CRL 75-36-700-3]EHS64281.1 hypothetical protein PGTG_22158 [Puccinia graminis f. sp. tritici CRL 75-36-700-3]
MSISGDLCRLSRWTSSSDRATTSLEPEVKKTSSNQTSTKIQNPVLPIPGGLRDPTRMRRPVDQGIHESSSGSENLKNAFD